MLENYFYFIEGNGEIHKEAMKLLYIYEVNIYKVNMKTIYKMIQKYIKHYICIYIKTDN